MPPRRIRSADLPFCFGCLLHQTSPPFVFHASAHQRLRFRCRQKPAAWLGEFGEGVRRRNKYKCLQYSVHPPKWLSPWHEIPQKWNICRVELAWPKAAPFGAQGKTTVIRIQLSLLRRRKFHKEFQISVVHGLEKMGWDVM